MRIEVSKSELVGALSALEKLVCRTSPVEVYRSLRIEGKDGKVAFRYAVWSVGIPVAGICFYRQNAIAAGLVY